MADKYNGWTNYETWRINLEILDDYADAYPETIEEYAEQEDGSYDLSKILEEHVDEAITSFGELKDDCLAVSYARAFASEANYYEIAENMIRDYKSNKEYEEKNK